MKHLVHKFVHIKNEFQSFLKILVTVSLCLSVHVFRQILILETLHG